MAVAHVQVLLLNHFVQYLASQDLYYQQEHPEYQSLLLILGVNRDRTPKLKATEKVQTAQVTQSIHVYIINSQTSTDTCISLPDLARFHKHEFCFAW